MSISVCSPQTVLSHTLHSMLETVQGREMVGRGPGEAHRGGGMDLGSEGRVGCLRGKDRALPGVRNTRVWAWEQARTDLEANE